MKRTNLLRGLAATAALIAIGAVTANRDAIDPAAVQAWLNGLGPWAAPAFVLAYAIGAPLFLPGSVLTLTGGAVFGPVQGTLLSLLGATLGATLSFLFARATGGGWVRDHMGGKLGSLVEGVDKEGWRFVAFVRLVPLFPYNLLNYALGLTRIRLVEYVVATAICMVPGAAAYSYLGYAGREALAGSGSAIQAGMIGLGLFATAAFLLPRLASWMRPAAGLDVEELARRIDGGEVLTLIDVRDHNEFCGPNGHIPGAVCIPVGELLERVGNIPQHSDQPIIVICKTDRRSTRAAKLLRQRAIGHVQILVGGVDSWLKQGHQIELCPPKAAPPV